MQNNKSFKINLSVIINLLIFITSLLGFILSCLFATRDGYYHWLTRLLYFTQQSNLWIGFTSLTFAIIQLRKETTEKMYKVISILKYIFTISITITGIIFCTLLAPFADYNVWTFSSVLTHIIVPSLSILDFFANKKIRSFEKKYRLYTFIPTLIYFIITSILCLFKVDFGRGDPFPYFFMDYYSEVGLFGIIIKWPPQIGSFYWFIFFFGFIYALSIIYYKFKIYLLNKMQSK